MRTGVSHEGLFGSIFRTGVRSESGDEKSPLGPSWGWILATGLLYIILGSIAFSMPVASTIGLTFGLAALFVAGGIFHLVQSFQLRRQRGAATRFLQSFLYIVVGALMFAFPGGGMLGVALALSFYFIVGAALEYIYFASLGPMKGRTLGFISSALSFLLGVFIIVTFPFSALWIPGALLGLNLLFSGAGLVSLSLAARKVQRESIAPTADRTPPSPTTLRPSPT